jgi:hypothetical protein
MLKSFGGTPSHCGSWGQTLTPAIELNPMEQNRENKILQCNINPAAGLKVRLRFLELGEAGEQGIIAIG